MQIWKSQDGKKELYFVWMKIEMTGIVFLTPHQNVISEGT